MSIFIIIGLSFAAYLIAIRLYGPLISRFIKVNDDEPTPAVTKCDNRDFIPTRLHVVFAHHFATIAGAGPILGPVIAILYGFVPAWIWVVLGGIFFGAVHDFTALFVSIKEGGRSLAEITHKTLGKAGFLLFAVFTLLMLLLLTAAFLNATATALTSCWPIGKLGLNASQTVLRTVVNPATGATEGVIGGIASTSVIIITLLSPLLGFLIFKKNLGTVPAYIFAALVAFGSIYIGFHHPITFDPHTWMIIISVYTLIAAGLPVWVILQPRDFTNVQILYVGLFVLGLGVITLGFKGVEVTYPLNNIDVGTSKLGLIWPMLFITVACGAISGFHGLVAGGTTSKQVSKQSASRKVGYGAMLLESILALMVLIVLASSLKYVDYVHIVWPEPGLGKANPILAFALGVGSMLKHAIGLPMYIGSIFGILMVEGFVVTTLDSSIRFIRYLLEEIWHVLLPNVPALLRNPWFNAAIAVVGMWALAAGNAFTVIWPIFGSVNQLMAALTLIAITMWLTLHGLKSWFTIIPAVFMMATTVVSLIILLFNKYIPTGNIPLMIAAIILLILAGALAVIAIGKTLELKRG